MIHLPSGDHVGWRASLKRSVIRVAVPPADGQGPPRLYAVRAPLRDNVYLGKTSKGIGFLDSADAMHEAYGPPDAEWVQMDQRLQYYQQGVIFATQHPKMIAPAVYATARAALGKQPSEAPDAAVVIGRPITMPVRSLNALGDRTNNGWHVAPVGSPEPARRHQNTSFPARLVAMASPPCRSGSKRASFCFSVSRGSPVAATRTAESCAETSTGCPTLNPTDLAIEDGILTAKLLPHR